MDKVTSAEFQRKFGLYRTKAHQDAVIITSHGRDDLALLSADEFRRLKSLDIKTHAVEDLSDEIIDGFGTEPLDPEADQHDHEYTP